jgi:chromosome segregation ATPase
MMAQPLPLPETVSDPRAAFAGHAPGAAEDDAGREAPDEARSRLAQAQQGILELRLDAAQSRISALETELAAQKLLLRQVQDDLAKAGRTLALQSHAGAQAAQERHEAATKLAALKQELHASLLMRQNLEAQIVGFADALKARGAEVARLERAADEVRARVKTTEARQNGLVEAHRQALREMAERLEEQRGEARLLHRALDLARDNRRALQAHIESLPRRATPELPVSASLAIGPGPDPALAFVTASPAVLSSHQGAPSVACSQ